MLLTMGEVKKIDVLQRVIGGRLSREEACLVLRLSERQVYRLLKRLKGQGVSGMVHGNRNRASPRRIKDKLRKRIISLAQGKYRDINDTHLREILWREEKIKIGRETLRSLLRGAGLSSKIKHSSPKHRSRRERKEAFGMMIQIDGSEHDWLEGRGPWMTLIGGKDDANSYVWARFEKAETTWGYFHLMERIFTEYGLPLSLYSDRHTIFFSNREPTIVEQLKNTGPLTQFGRAMSELGITLIPAYSPQAKGRIENQWKTFQDRLVVELRLAKVKTLEAANLVLEKFLKAYNQQFCVIPQKKESIFRKAPCISKLQRILSIKDEREVAKDHTVSFEGIILQIPPSKRFRSIAGKTVEVLQLKDGSIEIVYKQMTVARFSPEAVTRMIEQKKMKTELKRIKKAA